MKFINELIPFYPKIDELSTKLLTINDFNTLEGKTKEIIDGKIYNDKLIGFRAYQIFIKRFFSPFTPYNGLLMAHEMGSGKTCSAFLVISLFLDKSITTNKKVLILCHNSLQIENIKGEITEKCTKILFRSTNFNNTEKPQFLALLRQNIHYSLFSQTDELSVTNISLIIVDEVHTVHLQKDEKMLKKQLPIQQKSNLYFKMKKFLNKALSQNIKILLMTGTPISNHFSKLFQIMDFILPEELQFDRIDKDAIEEERRDTEIEEAEHGIAESKRDEIYFKQNILKEEKKHEIEKRFRGRISSFHSFGSILVTKEIGSPYKFFDNSSSRTIVYKNIMIGAQKLAYETFLKKKAEKREKDVAVSLELSAALFVYPNFNNSDITIGPKAFEFYIEDKNDVVSFSQNAYKADIIWDQKKFSFIDLLKIPRFLREHSVLYFTVLKELGVYSYEELVGMGETIDKNQWLKSQKEAAFFFNDVIKDSANKMFSVILKLHNFVQLRGGNYIENVNLVLNHLHKLENLKKQTNINNYDLEQLRIEQNKYKKPRFAIVSSNFGSTSDSEISSLIKVFSHPENRYGEYLRIIVGSEKMSHGYNLINGRQAHIVLQYSSPLMNQAIARLLREQSHHDNKEDRYVRIFRHVVVLDKPQTPLILFERRLQSLEMKENKNAQILHLLDKLAVDCPIHKKYHTGYKEYDNTYKCNFMPCNENFNCSVGNRKIEQDNLFLLYPNDEKFNLFIELMAQLFQRGFFSLKLDDILKHFQNKSFSRGEIFTFILKAIKEQVIFPDVYNINHVIGNYRDVIFLKKNNLFMKNEEEIITNIISPIKLEPDFSPFVFDEAFLLRKEKNRIIIFKQSPTIEGYRSLNIFARVFLFESVLPQPNVIVDEKIRQIILNVEKGNYITSEDILRIKKDKDLKLFKKFEGFLFHKIFLEFHTKQHVIRKEIHPEGLRFHDGQIKRGWRNVSHLIEEDVKEIIELMYEEEERLGSKITTPTTPITSTVSPQFQNSAVMTEEQLSKMKWADDYPLTFKFVKIVDIEGNFIKYKRVNLKKTENKEKRKGQDCKTLNFKSELDDYLLPFLEKIDTIIKDSRQDFVQDLLKKFIIEDVVFERNNKAIFSKQIQQSISEKLRNVRKDTKCELLFELQQILFPEN